MTIIWIYAEVFKTGWHQEHVIGRRKAKLGMQKRLVG